MPLPLYGSGGRHARTFEANSPKSALSQPVKLIVVFLIVNTIINVSFSQEMILNFDNFTVKEGLPSNAILCMIQDHKGFMWFGTQYGLCRYDGYSFINYLSLSDNPNSLSNNEVIMGLSRV